MSPRYGLTAQQRSALDFLRAYIDEHGESPSFDQIKTALNLKSKSGISRLIDGLEVRGYVRHLHNRQRSISLVREQTKTLKLLPPDLLARLDSYCERADRSQRDVVAEAVAGWLDLLEADLIAEPVAKSGRLTR